MTKLTEYHQLLDDFKAERFDVEEFYQRLKCLVFFHYNFLFAEKESVIKAVKDFLKEEPSIVGRETIYLNEVIYILAESYKNNQYYKRLFPSEFESIYGEGNFYKKFIS